MSQLKWDRALENGDGPATVVAYDDEQNELFWVRECFWPEEEENYWFAYITRSDKSKKVPGRFQNREDAEKNCEQMHELAEINHNKWI